MPVGASNSDRARTPVDQNQCTSLEALRTSTKCVDCYENVSTCTDGRFACHQYSDCRHSLDPFPRSSEVSRHSPTCQPEFPWLCYTAMHLARLEEPGVLAYLLEIFRRSKWLLCSMCTSRRVNKKRRTQ
jgi:hypothetical protein